MTLKEFGFHKTKTHLKVFSLWIVIVMKLGDEFRLIEKGENHSTM